MRTSPTDVRKKKRGRKGITPPIISNVLENNQVANESNRSLLSNDTIQVTQMLVSFNTTNDTSTQASQTATTVANEPTPTSTDNSSSPPSDSTPQDDADETQDSAEVDYESHEESNEHVDEHELDGYRGEDL